MVGGTPREWRSRDYYAVLGVPATASQEEIISAYRRLARAVHPDFDAGNPQAAERFEELAAAREVLSDPKARAAYDQIRRSRRPATANPPGPERRSATDHKGRPPSPAVRPGPVVWVPDGPFVRREHWPW